MTKKERPPRTLNQGVTDVVTLTWRLQLAEAKELFHRAPSEAGRHAMVSKNNRHRCEQCFCCACLTIVENNGQMPIETDHIPY